VTQTWWLSFCDGDRPKGQQFLGAVVIDVDEADLALALPGLLRIRKSHGLPPPPDGDDTYWLAAAIQKSHHLQCNPGGEVASMRLDHLDGWERVRVIYPRDRLLSRLELDVLEPVIAAAAEPQ
jgi:hypothetical protein